MLSGFPNSYKDPLYSQLARTVEEKLSLPPGILDALRTKGERSNANQVSSAGAEGPYQFIPSTRQGFIKNYGIDPWADPASQTEAAGLHVLGDYKRTGSWDEAIARYNGGQRPKAASYKYASRVGSFDTPPDTSKPYYTGNSNMPNPSIFPIVNGADPLAPEQPTLPTPVNASASPSISLPATSAPAAHKRGGILGALESIFMPDPGSQWAGALRDGLTNAKESQQVYQQNQYQKQLDLATANVKLRRMIQQGEFQIVGNNVFHIKPDGSYEMITAPEKPSDKETMFGMWQKSPDGSPEKQMLERILLGSQSNEAQQTAQTVAKIRGGSTIQAAKVRGSFSNPVVTVPQGWTVVK